ncbi:hypothetical protein, partial [uncultured Gimesia sp.]|uniref:hypothetical protein n=1 Tax=uncultured Gimesia sp. TaxID=1678688 RepID=UPI00262D7177
GANARTLSMKKWLAFRFDLRGNSLVGLDQPTEMFLAVDLIEPDCLEFRRWLDRAGRQIFP